MDEDKFNISVRKFLKVVGITAQREIEKAVREALNAGRLKGDCRKFWGVHATRVFWRSSLTRGSAWPGF